MPIKTVFVTGGGGYVGACLVPELLKKGYKVKSLDWYIFKKDVFDKYRDNPNLKIIKEDLRDRKILEKELVRCDAVIHLACISNDPSFELNPKLAREINFEATKGLVDIAKRKGVSRFIYASSSSVYGVKKEKEVTEDLLLEPLTDYSKYKAEAEKYVLAYGDKDFCVLVLRPATICGYSPRMRLDLTVNMLTIHALVQKKITVFGGKQMRPNIHIKDMVRLYLESLTYPTDKIAGKIYNCGYRNLTVSAIAKKVKKTIGDKNIVIELVPSNDNRTYRISSQKIKKELGFRAVYSVDGAIKDIAYKWRRGLIPNAESDIRYYNIRTMKKYEELFLDK